MFTTSSGNQITYDYSPKISYLSFLFLIVLCIAVVPMFVFIPLSIVGIIILLGITIPALYMPYWKSHKEDICVDVVIRCFGYGMIPGFILIVALNSLLFLFSMVVCFPNQTESLSDFFYNNSWRSDPISMVNINKDFSYYVFIVLICILARALPLVIMLYTTLPIIKHSLRSIHVNTQIQPFAYSVYLTASILGYNFSTTIFQMIADSNSGNVIETACVAGTLMLAIYTILSFLVNVEIVQSGFVVFGGFCNMYLFKSMLKPLLYIASHFFVITFIDTFRGSSSDDYSLQYLESGISVILSICVLAYVRIRMLSLTDNQTDILPLTSYRPSLPVATSPSISVSSETTSENHNTTNTIVKTKTNKFRELFK